MPTQHAWGQQAKTCFPKAAKTSGDKGRDPSPTDMNVLQHIYKTEGCFYQIWTRKKESYLWPQCRSISSPFLTVFRNNCFSFSLFVFLVFYLSLGLFHLHYFYLFSKLFLDFYFSSCHSSFCCLRIFILNFWYFSSMIFNFFFFLRDLTYWFATSHILPFFQVKQMNYLHIANPGSEERIGLFWGSSLRSKQLIIG